LRTIISKLWDYQQAILEIARLNRELKTYPDSIKSLEKSVSVIEESLKRTKSELDVNKANQKKKEEYLELCKSNLEKSESKLMEVTNQKDYSAVLNEIDYAKKEILETEEKLIAILESIERNEKNIEQFEKSLKEKQEELSKALEEFNTTKKGQIEKRENLLEKKKKLEQDIPVRYLKRFYEIAKKRNGVGVAMVEKDETCSACHMKIRPQKINEMKKNPDHIYTCENCQRILVIIDDENI